MKEQTKDNATARPWKLIREPSITLDGDVSHTLCIVDQGNVKQVALLGKDKAANAALIVKAVNSHDALVEALKQVQKLMEGDNTVSPFALCSYNDEDTILDQINTALKLAKEA